MKKYLMTGITALAFCGLFTSCTHDMTNYVGDKSGEIKRDYEDKFIERFGTPASDQEWGFGTTTAASRAGSRAISGIEFPTFKDGDCPDIPTDYFNTIEDAIAAGAHYAKDYQNYNNGDIVYINTDYQELSNQAEGREMTVYVDGEVTYLGKTNQNGKGFTFCVTEGSTLKLGQVCERLTVYLAPNATLDITEGMEIDWSTGSPQQKKTGNNTFTFTKDNAALYMSEGSKVKGTNIYFKDGYTVVNEGDSIKADELHVENGAILYNKQNSVVKTTGVIALRNTKGEIDNFGTMEGASMTLDANARFYNVAGGEVTISGLTKINNDSGNNAWMNGGQFNTGSFEITGGCQDPVAFNNCHMEVDGKFFMNEGNFVLDGGAAVECGSFEWKKNNYFHMGGKALLKVTGELLANNQNTGYGFYGDDTDYAVIQAGSIKKGSEGKFRAAYFGNLFVDTNNHFTQGESSADGTWYIFDDDVKFSFTDNTDVSHFQTEGAKTAQKAEDFSIDIPVDTEKGCSPGYHYGEENTETIRVIAEDLSVRDANADFDFNDVVFDVIWNKTQNKVSVKLLAAGGQLTMYVGGTADGVANVQPVNSLFQLANPDKTIGEKDMLNTDPDRHNEYKPYTYELDGSWWSGENIHTIAQSIYVRVMKNNELVTLEAIKGRAASKIAVGTDYDWCDERQDIDKKYPSSDSDKGKFSQYVGGMYTWNTWYK